MPVDSRSGLEWLIDNAEAYDRVLQSIATAQRSVWMTQLAFDADCVAYERGAPRDSASWGAGTVIVETLLAAVVRAPVDVRILLNATLLLDTTGPLRRFFAARLGALNGVPGSVGVRGLSRFPQLQHSKMVIVDGKEAFLLGSPFANGYWDDSRHAPVDPRRPPRELGGRPLHDVSVRVTGTPVGELQRIFEELWTVTPSGPDRNSIEHADETPVRPRRFGALAETAIGPVQVVCTSPARVLGDDDGGSTQIIEALLKGIAGARSLIYVEHQYLSARPVVAALAQALRSKPDLELIVVLNQNPDVTAYQRWQNARLAESGLLQHPRTGIFALWSVARDGRSGGPAALNQVFVHSKVLIVDDLWASSGSANLDGVSLHSYGDDFKGSVARRVFREVRNFDVNVVVRDDHGPGTVAGLRARLWAEHLALPAESVERRPPEGWLPLWRERAAANVAALARPGGADAMRGFVLPYSVQRTPALQLADLGVPIDPARIDLCFNPGWLEVQFSPNWVRNMFV
jgi:phosphatidylserine/phosphatidylglycerophosphate/cardiolipin synthase-like enzyme